MVVGCRQKTQRNKQKESDTDGTFFEPCADFPFVFEGGVNHDCFENTDRGVSVKPDSMAGNKICGRCW